MRMVSKLPKTVLVQKCANPSCGKTINNTAIVLEEIKDKVKIEAVFCKSCLLFAGFIIEIFEEGNIALELDEVFSACEQGYALNDFFEKDHPRHILKRPILACH